MPVSCNLNMFFCFFVSLYAYSKFFFFPLCTPINTCVEVKPYLELTRGACDHPSSHALAPAFFRFLSHLAMAKLAIAIMP